MSGMRQIMLDLDLDFSNEETRRRNENRLLLLLEALTQFNVDWLEDHPETPHLYDLGICYKRPEQLDRNVTEAQFEAMREFLKTKMGMNEVEISHHLSLARGIEIFRSVNRIIENGGGDCDNYSALRCAELRRAGWRGVKPGLVGRTVQGRRIMHAVTLFPDGTDEDPSRILGMGGESHFADRLIEIKKNYERYDGLVEQGKALVDEKRAAGVSGDELRAYAAKVQEKIDAFGLIPKDGIWKCVGNEPKRVLTWAA